MLHFPPSVNAKKEQMEGSQMIRMEETDIEEDATSEGETVQQTEHYDGAIVYAEKNKEHALDIMDEMNEITLPSGEKPKVCLYSDPKCGASKIAAGEEITKVCTLIFVLVTCDLHEDTVAQLIKDEAIGNTRLAKACHKDLKYCVRPLYIEKERDYKAPCGLSTIQPVNWYEKNERFFKRGIKQLFDQHMPYRKRRERGMNRQQSTIARNNQNYGYSAGNGLSEAQSKECLNFLQPCELQFPPDMTGESKNTNHSSSTNSAQLNPTFSEQHMEQNHLNSSQATTLSYPQSVASFDSGRGPSLVPSRGTSHMSNLCPISESIDSTSTSGSSETGSGVQNTNQDSTSVSGLDSSSTSQSSRSQRSTSVNVSGSDGFSAPVSPSNSIMGCDSNRQIQSGGQDRSSIIREETVEGDRQVDQEVSSTQAADARSSNQPLTSASTVDEETDGNSIIQSDLHQADVVEDVSMGSDKGSSSKVKDTESHNTWEVAESSGTTAVSSQTSEEPANPAGSASASDVSADGSTDKFEDDKQPETTTMTEHVLKHQEPGHRPAARCAAPNDQHLLGGEKGPQSVGSQPVVVHYHNHYHGTSRDPAVFPPPPGAPQPNTGMQGSASQGDLKWRTTGPINIVNCEHVQLGMNQMEFRGAGRAMNTTTTEDDEIPTTVTTVPESPPPAYSVEDPEGFSNQNDLQPYTHLSSSTDIKPQVPGQMSLPRQTQLKHKDLNSNGQTMWDESLKDDQYQTKEEKGLPYSGPDTQEVEKSSALEFPSAFPSLPDCVTRDGSHSSENPVASSGQQLFGSRVAEGLVSLDCSEPALADIQQDDTFGNGISDFSSLQISELGSGDDLMNFARSVGLSDKSQDLPASSKSLPSGAGPTGVRLPSCRLFCKHKRRQDMFVEVCRRMMAAGGPSVGGSGHDSDLD